MRRRRVQGNVGAVSDTCGTWNELWLSGGAGAVGGRASVGKRRVAYLSTSSPHLLHIHDEHEVSMYPRRLFCGRVVLKGRSRQISCADAPHALLLWEKMRPPPTLDFGWGHTSAFFNLCATDYLQGEGDRNEHSSAGAAPVALHHSWPVGLCPVPAPLLPSS